jgi:hypothetical protein
MLEGLLGRLLARAFVGIAYPLGLTLLLPLPLLTLLPAEVASGSAAQASLVGGVAAALVVGSLLASLAYTHSLGGSLKTLGRLTFLPGLVGLLLWVAGREPALDYAARVLPGFRRIEPVALAYVDRAVPSVRWLTIAFFCVGALLLLAGDRLAHRGTAGH